jgi:hypothetical protein
VPPAKRKEWLVSVTDAPLALRDGTRFETRFREVAAAACELAIEAPGDVDHVATCGPAIRSGSIDSRRDREARAASHAAVLATANRTL